MPRARGVGAALLLLGGIWRWWVEAPCALHEQRDLASRALLLGASLRHGVLRGQRGEL